MSEKTATLVSRVGWGLLILCAFALLGAGSGYLVFHFAQWQETRRTAPQTAPAPPRATAEPNDATAVWQSLGHWSGAGMQRTPAFRTSGSRFRIHWSAMPRDSAEKEDNFALHVTDRAGKQLQTPVSIVGAGSDTAYVGIKPGTYFLEVFTFDTQWEITIEEPR